MATVASGMSFVEQMREAIMGSRHSPDLRVTGRRIITDHRSDTALVSTATRSSLGMCFRLFDHLGHRLIDCLFHPIAHTVLEAVELSSNRVTQLIDRDVSHREPPP